MFNKVTIKGAKQAVQMFGPAQHGVAKAVMDCVAEGTIPEAEADNLFISVGVFIHWLAEDDKKIQEYSLKKNTNNKNSILKTYDLLLNTKYNVVMNQKTIERVKNFFQ